MHLPQPQGPSPSSGASQGVEAPASTSWGLGPARDWRFQSWRTAGQGGSRYRWAPGGKACITEARVPAPRMQLVSPPGYLEHPCPRLLKGSLPPFLVRLPSCLMQSFLDSPRPGRQAWRVFAGSVHLSQVAGRAVPPPGFLSLGGREVVSSFESALRLQN